MTATKTIRVSERTRERLGELARRLGQPNMDQAVNLLLSEHEQLEADRARRLALSEERLAEINRRRGTPLGDAVPVEHMVGMLSERTETENR